jgi:hypothetical protein
LDGLAFYEHRISEGRSLGVFLKSFDEVNEDGSGGYFKMSFLLGRKDVKFDDKPRLDELIHELTDTFAVRYEPEPSDKEINAYHQVLRDKGFTEEELVKRSPVLNRATRMASLKSPDWLVKTFRHHLEAGPWPLSDKAGEQTGGKRKRTAIGQVEAAGKVRKLHSGSHRSDFHRSDLLLVFTQTPCLTVPKRPVVSSRKWKTERRESAPSAHPSR